MIDWLCSTAVSYTPQDFSDLFSGLGALATGAGTIGLAYAAVKKIPKAIQQRNKSQEVIRLYQKVVYRMYRDVEATQEGILVSLPKDLQALMELLVKKHPQVGSIEDARKLMDDLMLDDYFRVVVGNQVAEKIVNWEPAKK